MSDVARAFGESTTDVWVALALAAWVGFWCAVCWRSIWVPIVVDVLRYLRGRLVPLALAVLMVFTQRRGWLILPAWALMFWRILRPNHGRNDG
jgi:hypothetical protein